MTTTTGTLYGIGVGPGDPELITLKATRVLSRVQTVFAAASTKNDHSLAVSIARPHIPASSEVRMMAFPMTRDRAETRRAWEANAREVTACLARGQDVAFLTLGDAMTYSTFGYLLKHVKRLAPDAAVETVPGITAYQAAAARVNTPLVEGEEALLVVSGVQGGHRLRAMREAPENIVFMKAYRNVPDIGAALAEIGSFRQTLGIVQCGRPDERVFHDMDELCARPPDYWTLVLAKQADPCDAAS